MRQCPKCDRRYFDETLNYCLEDGERLSDGSGSVEGATQILPGDLRGASAWSSSTAETEILTPGTDGGSLPSTRRSAGRHGPVSRRNSIVAGIAGMALVTALGVGGYYYYNGSGDAQIESVAVLPFENGTGDANLDYLSDGLSESLIDKLSQLQQIKVIARASSFRFRGPNIDSQDVAKKLGVHAVVLGKLEKQGEQLSVRVELVDTRDNKQVWGERYVRRTDDALAIQQEIAQTVSNKLRLRLSGEQETQLVRIGTANPQAYEFYLKGQFFRARSGPQSTTLSNQFFLKAVEADPGFAAANAYLAISYLILAGDSVIDPAEAHPKVEASARRAMELDPTLAEGHLALAGLYRDRWKWGEANQEYATAIGLNPNLADAHRRYSQFLSLMGRHDEAVAKALHGRELDPLSPRLNVYVSYAYLFARRFDEGITALTGLWSWIQILASRTCCLDTTIRERVYTAKRLRRITSQWSLRKVGRPAPGSFSVVPMQVPENGRRPLRFSAICEPLKNTFRRGSWQRCLPHWE